MRSLVPIFIFLALIGGAQIAVADASDYEALMREGVDLRRSGDDASALKRFQEAYRLNPTPKALTQVALAEQAMGYWVLADKHLRQAIAAEDESGWIRKNRESIDRALATIATHLGRIEIVGTPPGAEVRIDGELVGRLPLPGPVKVPAGGIAVEVSSPGFLPIARTPAVASQRLTREFFKLQQVPSLSPASVPPAGGSHNAIGTGAVAEPGDDVGSPPAKTSGSSGVRGVLILSAVSLSAASLGVGVFEHLSWQRKVGSFESNVACDTSVPGLGGAVCKQLHDDGSRARIGAFVGYGLAGAFAATALFLHLTAARSVSESSVACAPALPNAVACLLRF